MRRGGKNGRATGTSTITGRTGRNARGERREHGRLDPHSSVRGTEGPWRGTQGPPRVTTRRGGTEPCREEGATRRSAAGRSGRAGTRTGTPKWRNQRCSSAVRASCLRASPPSTRQTHRHQNRIMQHSWVDVWGTRRNGRCWCPPASGPGGMSRPESGGPRLSKLCRNPLPTSRDGRRGFVNTDGYYGGGAGGSSTEKAEVRAPPRSHP